MVDRVRRVVEDAAAGALTEGLAEAAVRRLAEVHEAVQYDCPVVLLAPANPAAARVLVEVQDDELWWVIAGDGPGTELYVGMEGDRYELLGSLVRAVVAGRYRHGPAADGWFETFDTDDGPFTSRHFGRNARAPSREARFAPYG